MRHGVLIFAAVLGIAAAPNVKPEPGDKDLEAFQGTWKVLSVESDGQKIDRDTLGEQLMVITGNKYVIKTEGLVEEEGLFKLDPTKKLRTVDFDITFGDDKDKKQLGVYDLDGKTLRICVAHAGTEKRPAALASKDGNYIFTMKKEK